MTAMQIQRKESVNEIFFLEKDYDKLYSNFRRKQQLTYTPEELLLVAKAAFLNQQYANCLEVLSKINPVHSTKVLYQRQSLNFRALYLLKRSCLQQTDIIQFSEILNEVDRLKMKCPGQPFQTYHFEVINNYKRFVIFLDQYRNSSITYVEKMFQQIQSLDRKTHKLTGFPCYLLSRQWYTDYQQMKRQLNTSKTYLGPLTNFSLVNDIYESHWYSGQGERYKNAYIFPINKFKLVSKKLWNLYCGVFSKDNQFCPIKRLFKQRIYMNDLYPISESNQLVQLVPVVVQCQNKTFLSQLTGNSLLSKELIPLLQQKFGIGQLKSQEKVQDSFQYFYFNERSQNVLSDWKKNLVYERKKLPENLRGIQVFRHLEYAPLPPTTMLSKQNGLKGLQNLGNSCYMGSCLQCISFTKQVATYLTTKDVVSEVLAKRGRNEGNVTFALSDTLKQLWRPSDRTSVLPYKFKKYFGIKNTMFKDKTQEDAHQFLLHLLNSVHEDLRKGNSMVIRSESKLQMTLDAEDVKNYFIKHELKDNQSLITENMRGIFHTTILCGKCNTSSHSFDLFLALSLPIPYVFYPSFYFYYVGFKSKNTLKYEVLLKNLKTFNDIFFIFEKQIINRKKTEMKSPSTTPRKELKQNNCYILLQYRSSDDPVQIWNSNSFNPWTNKQILIQNMLKSQNTFVLYEVDKNNYSQLVLVQYKYIVKTMISSTQINIGFPKFVNTNEKALLSTQPNQFKKSIVQNDIQNHFQERDIDECKAYKRPIDDCSFKYSISVFFKREEKLFRESKYVDKELNGAADVYTLEDCFEEMNKPQVLEGWKCGKCKSSKSAEKREFIYETNNILIISLKRFQANGNKIKNMVEYPIKGLNTSGWLQDNHYLGPNVYDLYGVCLHNGTMEYGHYKALCKHFVSGQWYQFDDERVRKIDVADVLSPFAYMLFYRKRQTI